MLGQATANRPLQGGCTCLPWTFLGPCSTKVCSLCQVMLHKEMHTLENKFKEIRQNDNTTMKLTWHAQQHILVFILSREVVMEHSTLTDSLCHQLFHYVSLLSKVSNVFFNTPSQQTWNSAHMIELHQLCHTVVQISIDTFAKQSTYLSL